MNLAQAADSSSSVNGVLLQYGALGVLALLAVLAVRVLFARLTAALDRETARADRLEEEQRKLNADVRTLMLTTLADATSAVKEAAEVMRKDADRGRR